MEHIKHVEPTEVHFLAFDPGGVTGWACIAVKVKAFTSHQIRVLDNVIWWDCGELEGTDNGQGREVDKLIRQSRFNLDTHKQDRKLIICTEDFDNIGHKGDKESLFSPIRMNAIIGWLAEYHSCEFYVQNRSLRINNTPERLHAFLGESRWPTKGRGKDATAAMQHAMYRLRTTKQQADRRPWNGNGNGAPI